MSKSKKPAWKKEDFPLLPLEEKELEGIPEGFETVIYSLTEESADEQLIPALRQGLKRSQEGKD